jgi:DNA-binding GntR family transcriptional regulator
MPQNALSQLFDPSIDDSFKLRRSLLKKDQVADFLRDSIVSGRIVSGTKLVERELAEYLEMSRVPVRDALLQLEGEGLVVSGPGGRSVIELTERDVRELHQVRLVLEKLAAGLAAQNASAENHAVLLETMERMKTVVAGGDSGSYYRSDVETHRLIWQQADNRHLLKTLDSMVGPSFMFIAKYASRHLELHVTQTLAEHEELIARISIGDVQAAQESMARHLENALQRSLQLFSTEGI